MQTDFTLKNYRKPLSEEIWRWVIIPHKSHSIKALKSRRNIYKQSFFILSNVKKFTNLAEPQLHGLKPFTTKEVHYSLKEDGQSELKHIYLHRESNYTINRLRLWVFHAVGLVPCTLERPINTDSLKTSKPSDSFTNADHEDPHSSGLVSP